MRAGAHAKRLELRHRRFGVGLRMRVADRDVRTAMREGRSDAAAHASAAAGDERDAPLEIQRHARQPTPPLRFPFHVRLAAAGVLTYTSPILCSRWQSGRSPSTA